METKKYDEKTNRDAEFLWLNGEIDYAIAKCGKFLCVKYMRDDIKCKLVVSIEAMRGTSRMKRTERINEYINICCVNGGFIKNDVEIIFEDGKSEYREEEI